MNAVQLFLIVMAIVGACCALASLIAFFLARQLRRELQDLSDKLRADIDKKGAAPCKVSKPESP